MYAERILLSPSDLAQRTELLASRGLSVPGGGVAKSRVSASDVVLGLFEDFSGPEGEKLAATGSLIGNTLQGVAVREELEGQGLTSELLSLLLRYAADAGIWHLFLFTKPQEAPRFAELGFRPVAATDSAALLEWGRPGIEEFLQTLRRTAESFSSPNGSRVHDPGGGLGAEPPITASVVVNCNPFTLGHRYLVETAAAKSQRLYVLVVQEDRSEFPFEVRFRLVREGVSGLGNVTVLSGGEYCVSAATFPSYFTRREELASVHAALDLTVFATRVAPALSVKKRFVGTEPFSHVTNVYNETMKTLLPRYGIEVEELTRLEIQGEPVSASRVRALLREGRMEEAKILVPPSTRRWLDSPEAVPVLEGLR
ncbi:MAG: [citrate (pro-3S)-lyase] ligase [Synergistaceae bacterium]|jgi:[citrate (pro-3S)-lyase] ligase|nr:[citrate (pro-3S)-lyase] ligase [Synergistaceae bacterium]